MKCEKLPERSGPNDVPRCPAGRGRPRPAAPPERPRQPGRGRDRTERPGGTGLGVLRDLGAAPPAVPYGERLPLPVSIPRVSCVPPGAPVCPPPCEAPERSGAQPPAPPLRRGPSNREGNADLTCPGLGRRSCSKRGWHQGMPTKAGIRAGVPGQEALTQGLAALPFPIPLPKQRPPHHLSISPPLFPPAFLPPQKTQLHMRGPIDIRANK